PQACGLVSAYLANPSSKGTKVDAMRSPIRTENTGPSGPPIAIAWLMRLPPAAGATSQRKENFEAGNTAVSSRNLCPGSTPSNRMRCSPPALVRIAPVVPVANGPSRDTDSTSGFHFAQVDVSDQIFQTSSGGDFVSRERL